jgi:hypothetical protein
MVGAVALECDPRVFAFVSKTLHLDFRLLECGWIRRSEFRHLRGRNRELNRKLHERFCQLVPLLAIGLTLQFPVLLFVYRKSSREATRLFEPSGTGKALSYFRAQMIAVSGARLLVVKG